ncbi:MAG: hypothetical protein LBV67_09290 [Streptococcaceae bacterium]|jgi:DNA-directed RNA polymerase subunit RPC12/RpoP|nr:hypothetical protein [Streptococcaceae bacterium]
MAGMKCPKCGNLTFFEIPTGRKCSKCGYEMKVPADKKGKGKKCFNCGKYQVFDGKCRNCGAIYKGIK